MFNQENDFYISLLSSNSMKYYPDNTLSSFTNHLASPCNLDGSNWKVGVTEIAFNSYYRDSIYKHSVGKRSADAQKTKLYNVPPNPKSNLTTRTTPLMNMQPVSLQPFNPILTKIQEENEMIVMQGESQSTPNGSFTPVMYLPKALSPLPDTVVKQIVDNEKDTSAVGSSLISNSKKTKKIHLQQEQQLQTPNEIESFDIPPPISTENKNDLLLYVNRQTTNLNYMYVYTDIIKPRYIGDIKSRYLRVIPKLETHAEVIKFDHIEYCAVEKGYIENLSILILNTEGEKINFIGGTSPTYVMLHFVKQ